MKLESNPSPNRSRNGMPPSGLNSFWPCGGHSRSPNPRSRLRRDARRSRADPAPRGPPLQSAEERSTTGISRTHV